MKNSIIPSLDDITMTELQNIIDEMQHEDNIEKGGDGETNGENQIDSAKDNGGSGGNQVSDVTSAIALFDKL